MGRSYFLTVLLFSTVLALCFSQGFGRKVMRFEKRSSYNQLEVKLEKGREVTEFAMDYEDPGANTNPRTGYLLNPPPPRRP